MTIHTTSNDNIHIKCTNRTEKILFKMNVFMDIQSDIDILLLIIIYYYVQIRS